MKKIKFNLIDLIIVLCVVGAVFVCITVLGGLKGTSSAGNSGNITMRYGIELTKKSQVVLDAFMEAKETGAACFVSEKERAKAYVKDVYAEPAKKLTTNMRTGKAHLAEIPGEYDITVILESEGTETEKDILAEGKAVIKVGCETAVKGKGFAGFGFVTSLEIVD